jgi:hypothetical protein
MKPRFAIANETDLTDKNSAGPKTRRWKTKERDCMPTLYVFEKHLRRREVWLWRFNTICAAVADEPETRP